MRCTRVFNCNRQLIHRQADAIRQCAGKSRSFIRGVRSPLRRVMTQTDQSPKIQLRHYLMTSRSSLAVSDFNHEVLSNHRDGGSVELYG
jgi:hypothetical protein